MIVQILLIKNDKFKIIRLVCLSAELSNKYPSDFSCDRDEKFVPPAGTDDVE